MANYFAKDKRWEDLTQAASQISENLREAITRAKKEYEEFQLFVDSRTAGNIASALVTAGDTGVVAGDVTKMIDAFDAMNEIYDFANNAVPAAQGDRFALLRQFNR